MPIKRSKQGCFTCRARRKKCDEKRPKCLGCDRNFLDCVWPLYQNQTLLLFKRSKLENDGFFTFSLRNVEKLNFFNCGKMGTVYSKFITGKFINSLMPEPTSDKARKSLAQQLQTSLPLQLIVKCVDTLLGDGKTSQEQLFDEALNTLRAEIERSSRLCSEDWCLNAINLLMIRELMLSALRITEIIKHLEASFHIIFTRISLNDSTFWLRLNTDTFVFYSGMVSLCCLLPELERLPHPYESEKIFEPLHESNSSSHDFKLHPILGDYYEPIILNNQASYLLRSNSPYREKLARTLLRKINGFLEALAKNSFYIAVHCCTKIVLLKIIYPNILLGDRDIQFEEERLIQSLRLASIKDVQMFGIWPIIVCAACSNSVDIIDLLIEISKYSGVGGVTFEARQNFKYSLKRIWDEGKGPAVIDDISFLKLLLLNP